MFMIVVVDGEALIFQNSQKASDYIESEDVKSIEEVYDAGGNVFDSVVERVSRKFLWMKFEVSIVSFLPRSGVVNENRVRDLIKNLLDVEDNSRFSTCCLVSEYVSVYGFTY